MLYHKKIFRSFLKKILPIIFNIFQFFSVNRRVINFLNDDTESIGESEAIDASILNNISRAAHAAGSSLGTAIDMSTTNYNF